METSIDEGIETEEPDTEDDPAHLLSAYQTARFGQRRHTLSEVTNQPGPSNQGMMSADDLWLKNKIKCFLHHCVNLESTFPPKVNCSPSATTRPPVAWTQTWATIWGLCKVTWVCWRILSPPSLKRCQPAAPPLVPPLRPSWWQGLPTQQWPSWLRSTGKRTTAPPSASEKDAVPLTPPSHKVRSSPVRFYFFRWASFL